MLSKNITIKNDVPQEETKDDRSFYKDQLLVVRQNTCLEKGVGLEPYDPDTMKSLNALIKSNALASVTRMRKPTFSFQETSKSQMVGPQTASKMSLPQWLKFDKNCLRFEGYFDEHVNESAHENWKIRPVQILYYLDDDSLQIIEHKTENSGMPQGDLLKRHRALYDDKSNVRWQDINLGKELYIYGKKFRVCSCDKFTQDFYAQNGIKLNQPEKVPEIDFSEKYKNVDYEKIKKIIADSKEFTEVSLKGGHPNRGLKQFLENDRKVLSFDIIWYDEKYDKEEKKYKLNYYLADNQAEVCEIKINNSGKDPFPRLLRKSKLPKKAHFSYCPGLLIPEDEYYLPKDLLIGNIVDVYNRKCKIVGCDEFTKNWFKENLGINMDSFKFKRNPPPTRIIHPIPPYNGYGSEEDSLLNVRYLDPVGKIKEYYTEKFKRDKHILRFLSNLVSSNPADEDRRFLISYYLRDEAIQVYEIAGRNSGRESGKFYEKQRIKNPYTGNYYLEKDFKVGNLIYVNNYIFKLLQSDEYTRKYMRDNPEIFKDSDINFVTNRIKTAANGKDFETFLVQMLKYIDPQGVNYVTGDSIAEGLKNFGVYLSTQELVTLIGELGMKDGKYSMEDLYNLINGNF